MREISEQEKLARLVGNSENLEPIDTASMLENSLMKSLGGISIEKMNLIKEEIKMHGDDLEEKPMKRVASSSNNLETYSTEKLLLSLYDVRDELVEAFESAGINSKSSLKLGSSISKIEACIHTAGGSIDKFIPLNHLSGLSAPNLLKNAQKVIDTTLQCYKLGKVELAEIKDGGNTIQIVFSGNQDGTDYVADGIISAEEWTGNEAIDYVYTPGEGNMTVKAYENGRWIIKSMKGNDRYKVLWKLKEKEISTKNEIPQDEKVIEKIATNKKEMVKDSQNNIDSEEEIGDSI